MSSDSRTPRDPLNGAIEEIRRCEPRPNEMEDAASRVWARVSEDAMKDAAGEGRRSDSSMLRGCPDYQSLIPDYRAGRLSEARTLLLEDHSRECLPCRRALNEIRFPPSGGVEPGVGQRAGLSRAKLALGAVAALLLLALVGSQSGLVRQILFPVEVRATVETLRGQLFQVDGPGLESLQAGAAIGRGQTVRTARDSGAILELADGSRVEMRERSQLSFVPARDGVRVALDRGSVIVRAADQESGHLYVSADEVDVAVVGTVFSVTAGAKGARVSVLEGEVRVEHGSLVESLLAGEQYNGAGTLTPVPVEEEIAWSQELETHMALLEELSAMRGELEDAFLSPDLRYGSNLIAVVPQDTVVYAAFPNVARSLSDAYEVFTRRIQENPLTAQWWSESLAASQGEGLSIDEMMERIRAASDALGEEVVMTLGEGETPLFLAEVTDEDGVADFFQGFSDVETVLVARSPEELSLQAGTSEALAYVSDGILVFSPEVDRVIQVVSSIETGSAFAGGEFYQSLAAAYADGVDWLFAVNLASLVDLSAETEEFPAALGFQNLRTLVVDHKRLQDQVATRAIMDFDGSGGGVVSWIESPGPMGGLEFVSPDAFGVVAGLSRNPETILNDIFESVQEQSAEAWTAIQDFEQVNAIDLRRDLAAPLGGEFLVAIDGPLLPEPSWKLVAEVYDSARLQNAIEWMVIAVDGYATAAGRQGLEIVSESVDGRIFYVLRDLDSGNEVHYTYSSGYLVAAPARVLVSQALEYQQTRYSLGTASAFRDLFPAGGEEDCSAVIYQNMTHLVSSVTSYLDLVGETADSEELGMIQGIAQDGPPTLACVVAEPDRIIVSNQGELPFNLFTLGGLSALMEALPEVSP